MYRIVHMMFIIYVNITGSANNKNVYIYQSYRKENANSSCIYRKLGKFNELLEKFNGDKDALMAWSKDEATKDTAKFNKQKKMISIELSPMARIPLNEKRSFTAYIFLQKFCSDLRIDNICRNILNSHKKSFEMKL